MSTGGLPGGRDGSPNYVEVLRPGDAAEAGPAVQRYGKVSRLRLRRGDLVRLVTGTGGGFGDPRERDPALVLADLRDGIITRQEAVGVYGATVEHSEQS